MSDDDLRHCEPFEDGCPVSRYKCKKCGKLLTFAEATEHDCSDSYLVVVDRR